MIATKLGLIALWLGFIAGACGLSFLSLIPSISVQRRAGVGIAWACAALLLFAAPFVLSSLPAPTSPLVLSLGFAGLSATAGMEIGLGGAIALPFLATMNWWSRDFAFAAAPALVFLAIGVLAVSLPRLTFRETGLPALPTFAALLGLAAISTLMMGQFSSPRAFYEVWHHWGAYISPVLTLSAGGVPFADFPVQYGLGPTLLIAALGFGDPWLGTYLAAALTNAIYLVAMGACVHLTMRDAPRGLALLAGLALVSAVLLWTGFGPDFRGPMAYPSVGGMRFMPLALLLAAILWSEKTGRSNRAAGYAIWLFGLAWSPEAGIYSTLVWFPYRALRTAQTRGADKLVTVASSALLGVDIALAALVAGVAILALPFRCWFGVWPSAEGFLTYILNPPGMLPPDPRGPIWLLLATLAIGCLALTRLEARDLRTHLVCLLGLAGASSYYLLGRSHDNNALVLFPFVVLLLASALSAGLPAIWRGFSRMALTGMIAWPATFGFQSWTTAFQNGEAATLGPARLIDRFRLADADASAHLDAGLSEHPNAGSADLGAALAWLADQRAGPPVVDSPAMIIPRVAAGSTWTGVNNLANVALLPREIIVRFIHNGAATFHRPGWLLVDRTDPGPWVELFQTAFDIVEERRFGQFTAYRLAPKTTL